MALLTMKKLTVVGLQQDKSQLYDAIVRSKCVQLKRVEDVEQTVTVDNATDQEQLATLIARVEDAIDYIASQAEVYNNVVKRTKSAKIDVPQPSFRQPFHEMTYSQFVEKFRDDRELVGIVDRVDALRQQRTTVLQEQKTAQQELSSLQLYKPLNNAFDYYTDTDNAIVALGTFPLNSLQQLNELQQQFELVSVETVNKNSDNALLVVVAHKTEQQFVTELYKLGFSRCTYKRHALPVTIIDELTDQLQQLAEKDKEYLQQIAQCAKYLVTLRVYTDYLQLQYKKLVADSNLANTDCTFLLEGYYPQNREQELLDQLNQTSDCLVVRCEQLAQGEQAPTLVHNNKVVGTFEQVTNMYTPPVYKEVDPNPVMSFFYFVIFGLMVADMGYGLLLAITGLLVRLIVKQDTGIRRLTSLFGVCGLSAILVGAMYGSIFSYTLYNGILPDASKYPTTTMVICLLFGILHIMAGIALKVANQISQRDYVGAFLVSFMWIVFFGGLFAFVLQPALQFMDYQPFNSVVIPPIVSTIGMYTMIGSLVIIVFSAGYDRKGFAGKVIAGFGSVYGILNYFGDVMSYIRIFGLMLSSAMMGVVINDMAGMISNGTVVGYFGATILLIFAHVFNLVIGVLGVYIHDGRLQYVEFFGKFYTGDGQLFVPFGSEMKYTLITDNK